MRTRIDLRTDLSITGKHVANDPCDKLRLPVFLRNPRCTLAEPPASIGVLPTEQSGEQITLPREEQKWLPGVFAVRVAQAALEEIANMIGGLLIEVAALDYCGLIVCISDPLAGDPGVLHPII